VTVFEKGRGLAYLPLMALPRPSRPSVVWSEFKAVLTQQGSHKLLFAGLALLIPAVVLLIFILSPIKADYRGPDIIFAESWPANRSEADIIRQQAIDAPKEREQRRLEAEAIAEHKRQLRKVADALGIEVDEK
jgi:hypothetical protein